MQLDETATTAVKAGDIGFWPPGNALAIFFGPTPKVARRGLTVKKEPHKKPPLAMPMPPTYGMILLIRPAGRS